MPAVASVMLYGCVAVTQDMRKGLLVLPLNLAADVGWIHSPVDGAVWK